ncbi:MAG TPA: outer membrane beta-barrel protein [Ferruginibacter sp.]|nr:outer membrane beta-barrel protein [Ferruginibacter sp.]
MKRITLVAGICVASIAATAQTDTIYNEKNNDTMRVGNILIIKKGKKEKSEHDTTITMAMTGTTKRQSRISTNWWVVDLGFSNYDDQTNYAGTGSYLINKPGSPAFSESDFKLRSGKSINVNIWLFMQRLSLIKRNVNLKYGLGVELNNYRYKSTISYKEGGIIPYSGGLQTNAPFIFRDSISFSKNKLAADYLTVPLMLNFATNSASSKKGLSLSVGVSAGYLYSQRNKQVSDERGKQRNKGEYDLERFKLSYIGELGLGPVRLYGSYSPKSMYEHSLDIRPYNIGFRISNW